MLKNFNIKKIKINKSELKEKFDKIIAQYDRDAIIYTVLLIALVGYGLFRFIFPGFSDIGKNISALNIHKENTKMMEQKIKALSQRKEKQEKKVEIPVKIFESQIKDVELENAATGLVNRVVEIIKENGNNQVEQFEFTRSDLVDSSGLKSKNHSLLRLHIQMESTYENVQSILNDIYLLEYLVKVNKVSMVVNPESNYKQVTAFIILDLFVKTS